jgi:hypothetical protein
MGTGGVIGPREGEDVRAHVERQVRAAVGKEVAACERFGEFVTGRTVP